MLDEPRLELAHRRDRAQAFELAEQAGEPSGDAPPLGGPPVERAERLLALDRVLDDVGGEAVQPEPHVDLVIDPP